MAYDTLIEAVATEFVICTPHELKILVHIRDVYGQITSLGANAAIATDHLKAIFEGRMQKFEFESSAVAASAV